MAKKLHTIQNQSFDVNFPEESEAIAFRERFSSLVREKLLQVIEKVFDKASPDENVYRISQLTVDLGDIDYSEWEQLIPKKLEDKLTVALERKIRRIKTSPVKGKDEFISNERSLLETFIFYLNTGTIPWWGKYFKEKSLNIQQTFELLLAKMPKSIVQAMQQVISIPIVQKRLIHQVDDPTIFIYVGLTTAENMPVLKSFYEETIPILIALRSKGYITGKERELLWEFIIEQIVLKKHFAMTESLLFEKFVVDKVLPTAKVGEKEFYEEVFKVVSRGKAHRDNKPMLDAIEEVLVKNIRQLEGNPIFTEGSMEDLLSSERNNEEKIKDWIGYANETDFLEVIKREAPAQYGFISSLLRSLILLFPNELSERGANSTSLVKKLREFVLQYLYVERIGREFHREKFLPFMVDRVAQYLKIDYGIAAIKVASLDQEYEILSEKTASPRKYGKNDTLRFFLLFGVIPRHSVINNIKEAFALLLDSSEDEIREVFSGFDRAINPIISQRVKRQFSEEMVEKIFSILPDLSLADLVENSFDNTFEVLLKKISSQQGLLAADFETVLKETKKWIENKAKDTNVGGTGGGDENTRAHGDKATGNTEVGDSETEEAGSQKEMDEADGNGGKAPKEEAGTRVLSALENEVLLMLEKGFVGSFQQLKRSQAADGVEKLIKKDPEAVRRAIGKGGLNESARNSWVKEFPEHLLLSLAYLIKPNQLKEIVQLAELFIVREIKLKRYASNYPELKLLKWRLIFTSSQDEIKRSIQKQQEEFQKRSGIKTGQSTMEKSKLLEKVLGKEPIYVKNAGLVIFAPYLSRYLKVLGLLQEDGKGFKDHDAAVKGVYMLQYLAFKNQEVEEYELVLNKVICGLPIYEAIEGPPEIKQEDIDIAESLVNGVIQNWPTLGKTSPDNFRVSFLHRDGKLEKSLSGAWDLHVEQKGWDVIMDTIPWSVGMVVLPWMGKNIQVHWR